MPAKVTVMPVSSAAARTLAWAVCSAPPASGDESGSTPMTWSDRISRRAQGLRSSARTWPPRPMPTSSRVTSAGLAHRVEQRAVGGRIAEGDEGRAQPQELERAELRAGRPRAQVEVAPAPRSLVDPAEQRLGEGAHRRRAGAVVLVGHAAEQGLGLVRRVGRPPVLDRAYDRPEPLDALPLGLPQRLVERAEPRRAPRPLLVDLEEAQEIVPGEREQRARAPRRPRAARGRTIVDDSGAAGSRGASASLSSAKTCLSFKISPPV